MPVAAHNEITSACQCTGKKFIVIRILTNFFRKRNNGKGDGILDYICKHGFQADCWMFLGKYLSHAPIFVQYFGGDNHLDLSILPCLQNLIWRSTEKDPRNKHICVENYFH